MNAFLYLFAFLFSTGIFCQNPNFYSLTKNDGLPSNDLYSIYQDRAGFMWFATQKGLCKYDGSKFTTYTIDSQSNVAGSAISQDKYGRIWYCNFDGFLFYIENNKLNALDQKETIGYYKYGIIDDELFLIQKNKVAIYDLGTLKVKKSIPISGERLLTTFNDQNAFYVLSDNLIKITKNGAKKEYPLPKDFRKNYAAVIIQKSKQGLIIASKNSKKSYEFINEKLIEKKNREDFDFIQNLDYIDDSNWFATTAGIYKMSDDDQKLKNKIFFPEYNVTTVFKDSQQNYWFATQNRGLLLVPNLQSVMIPLPSRPLKIVPFKNNFLISTNQDALFLYHSKDQSIENFHQGKTKHPINQLTVDPENLNVYFTSSYFTYLNSKKTEQASLFLAVKDFKKIDNKYYSFAASGVSGIYTVNNQLKSDWDQHFNSNESGNLHFHELEILKNSNGKCTIYNPTNQSIYFGTNSGLFYKNRAQEKELKFEGKSLYILSLAYYKSAVFALASNGTLLKITSDQKITRLPLPNNLKKAEIFRIKIMQDELYLITENALYEYDLKKNTSKILMYGIQDLDLTDLIKSQQGFLLMTGQGILVVPDPKPLGNRIPKFMFTEVQANNEAVPFVKLNQLKPDQTNLRINFAVLSFIPGHQPEIFYRINKDKWQTLEKNSRSLLLSTLTHGNYVVEFQTKSGDRFSEVYRLRFSIEKPFYLKAWFLILGILLLILFIYFLFSLRLKKIQRQNELALEKINLEKNLNQSKLKAIKSQMNPHFFYNALNTIQAYILSNEKKLAVGYLSKFSLLTRTILEMTEKDYVTVANEIKTLTLYLDLEKVRFNDDFTYQIVASENSELQNASIPTMLLQPYIENALKHGLLHKKGPKKLTISFSKGDENLLITINDNGIGRQKSNELNALRTNKPQPFATEAMSNRIDLLNESNHQKMELSYADNFDKNGDSAGTTVLIKLPLL